MVCAKRPRLSALMVACCVLLVSTALATASGETETTAALASSEVLGPLVEVPGCSHLEPVPIIELGEGQMPDPITEECSGLRPGARLVQPGCTMNFLFTDGTEYYMGTAGHCTQWVGQRMRAGGIGEFGTVVFRHFTGVGQDFALIQVDSDKHDLIDATMCSWLGPRDAEPVTHPGQVVHMYGWGSATNEASFLRARSGTLTTTSSTTINFIGVASGGDSGSPSTNALGSALGINTHVLLTGTGSAVVYGTHIDHALGMVRNAGFDVHVVEGDWVL